MQSLLKSKPNTRIALFWAILGALGALAVFPYVMAIAPFPAPLPISLPAVAIGQAIQSGLLLWPLCWLGLRLGRSLGLDSPLARAWLTGSTMPTGSSRRWLGVALLGVVGGLAILALDMLLQPWMPDPLTGSTDALPQVARWKGLLACFYGGITEELWLRLGLMTLIAWGLWRLAARPVLPRGWIFGTAIALSALLFGLGHLPATAVVWPLTGVVIGRSLVLNGLLGLVFGTLYWKIGLEAAMLAHFCADLVLRGLGGS
ncbi:MAG: CPBP family glutamic-type intramembrane protease [Cyanobacteriota bacterium]